MKYSNTKATMVFFPFLSLLLLILVYKYGKVAYLQTDNFHFEVTPEKLCQGFPYMQTSDPQLFSVCSKLLSTPKGNAEFAKYNCTESGFGGAPVHFEFTPLSNDKWENERCDNISFQGPIPL